LGPAAVLFGGTLRRGGGRVGSAATGGAHIQGSPSGRAPFEGNAEGPWPIPRFRPWAGGAPQARPRGPPDGSLPSLSHGLPAWPGPLPRAGELPPTNGGFGVITGGPTGREGGWTSHRPAPRIAQTFHGFRPFLGRWHVPWKAEHGFPAAGLVFPCCLSFSVGGLRLPSSWVPQAIAPPNIEDGRVAHEVRPGARPAPRKGREPCCERLGKDPKCFTFFCGHGAAEETIGGRRQVVKKGPPTGLRPEAGPEYEARAADFDVQPNGARHRARAPEQRGKAWLSWSTKPRPRNPRGCTYGTFPAGDGTGAPPPSLVRWPKGAPGLRPRRLKAAWPIPGPEDHPLEYGKLRRAGNPRPGEIWRGGEFAHLGTNGNLRFGAPGGRLLAAAQERAISSSTSRGPQSCKGQCGT